jgi:hypothetical protein
MRGPRQKDRKLEFYSCLYSPDYPFLSSFLSFGVFYRFRVSKSHSPSWAATLGGLSRREVSTAKGHDHFVPPIL